MYLDILDQPDLPEKQRPSAHIHFKSQKSNHLLDLVQCQNLINKSYTSATKCHPSSLQTEYSVHDMVNHDYFSNNPQCQQKEETQSKCMDGSYHVNFFFFTNIP